MDAQTSEEKKAKQREYRREYMRAYRLRIKAQRGVSNG